MYKMRRWSTRHAQVLHSVYANVEKTRKAYSMIGLVETMAPDSPVAQET